MKIKRKVQKTLPQLIEWGFENDMRNKSFESEGGAMVYFDYDGNLTCARGFVPQDFFTVTSEEEITEDTVIPILIERRDFGNELTYSRYEYVRIKDIKEESSTLFYIENDDKSLTLIWRDGRLVE